ncbi:Uncharacterised protein [Mycobacteroides abscessus subsp. abscessus]|nr:Uncharacterised protein [Mycobacteroides abscessus subsp. abscessus]
MPAPCLATQCWPLKTFKDVAVRIGEIGLLSLPKHAVFVGKQAAFCSKPAENMFKISCICPEAKMIIRDCFPFFKKQLGASCPDGKPSLSLVNQLHLKHFCIKGAHLFQMEALQVNLVNLHKNLSFVCQSCFRFIIRETLCRRFSLRSEAAFVFLTG